MISQKCKYALRAIFYLSIHSNETKKVNIRDLSSALKMPAPFLGKILQELVQKDLLCSIKGPSGGFFLSEKNLDQPLISIVEAIDGLSVFSSCGLGIEGCSDDKPCPVHFDFKPYRDKIQDTFKNNTVKDLAEQIETHSFFLVR